MAKWVRWSRKVRPGGIVSGHDYADNHIDVRLAVENFVARNNIYPWYIVGKEHETGDPNTIPSWFWVKP